MNVAAVVVIHQPSYEVFEHFDRLILLSKGKCKNETWVGGVYRITPGGAYGEKSISWKEEVTEKQRQIIKKAHSYYE